LGGAILFCADGLGSYPTVIKDVFREKTPGDETGRCRLIEWPNILIARVIKGYEHNRVVGMTLEIYKFCERGLSAYSRQMNFASASLRADPLSTIKALSLMIQV
jgi:hypothetical protein